MAKTLQRNVTVGDKTYGPDYPQNDPTGVDIPSWAYDAGPDESGAGDFRFTAADFASEHGDTPPNLRGGEPVSAARKPSKTADK